MLHPARGAPVGNCTDHTALPVAPPEAVGGKPVFAGTYATNVVCACIRSIFDEPRHGWALHILSFLLAFVFNSKSGLQVANAARRIRAEMNDAQNGSTGRSEGRVPTTQGTQNHIGPPEEGAVGHSFAIGGAEWEEGHSAKRVVEAIVYADLMAVGKKFATQASSQVRTLEAAERIVMKLKAAFDIALTTELATAKRADAQSREVSSGALPPASRQTVAPTTAGAISMTASARAPATAGERGRGASGGRALGSCRGRGGRGGRGGGEPARLRAHEEIHDRGSGGPGDVDGAENGADKAAASTRPAAAGFSHVGGMGGVGVLPEGPLGVAALPQNTPTGAIDGSTDASLSSGDLVFSGERSNTDFRQATGATGSTFHAGRTDRRDCLPPPPGRSNIETVAGVGGCGSDQAWSGVSNVGEVGSSGHGSNQAWAVGGGGSGGGGHGGHVMGSSGSGGSVGVGVDGSNRAGNDSVGVAQGSSQLGSGGGVGDHGSDQARGGGVGGYGSDQLGRGDGASVYRFGNEGNVGVGVDVGGVGAGGVGVGYDTNRDGSGGGVYDRAVSSGSNMAASEDTCPPLYSREAVAAKRRKKSSRVQGRG